MEFFLIKAIIKSTLFSRNVMNFSTKTVKICGLKAVFIFFTKKPKMFIFSFYKVEKNVKTVYDYPHDAYYGF